MVEEVKPTYPGSTQYFVFRGPRWLSVLDDTQRYGWRWTLRYLHLRWNRELPKA